jgi:hypothetical protein
MDAHGKTCVFTLRKKHLMIDMEQSETQTFATGMAY